MPFVKGDVRFASRWDASYFVIDRYACTSFDQSQNPVWALEAEDCADHYDEDEISSVVMHLNRCEPWSHNNG